MTKKAEEGGEDQDQEGAEDQDQDKPEEKLSKAEERAAKAEARAEAAEKKNAEIESSRGHREREEAPSGGYNLGSFSEAEWAEAESSTGKDRKDILFSLNLQAKTEKKVRSAVGNLETKLAVREEVESLAGDEPLYPKFRKEVAEFLKDIPAELMATNEGRKKWVGKAFDYAKRGVKVPTGSRKADGAPDTRETGKGKQDGGKKEYSEAEKAIFAEHGKTAEDYDKMQDPMRGEGVVIKHRPEAPTFG